MRCPSVTANRGRPGSTATRAGPEKTLPHTIELPASPVSRSGHCARNRPVAASYRRGCRYRLSTPSPIGSRSPAVSASWWRHTNCRAVIDHRASMLGPRSSGPSGSFGLRRGTHHHVVADEARAADLRLHHPAHPEQVPFHAVQGPRIRQRCGQVEHHYTPPRLPHPARAEQVPAAGRDGQPGVEEVLRLPSTRGGQTFTRAGVLDLQPVVGLRAVHHPGPPAWPPTTDRLASSANSERPDASWSPGVTPPRFRTCASSSLPTAWSERPSSSRPDCHAGTRRTSGQRPLVHLPSARSAASPNARRSA